MSWLNRFTTGGIPADAKGTTMVERISRGYFGYSYLKIEAQITFFFRSKIINLSFIFIWHWIWAKILLTVNIIFTDGIRMFSENSYLKIEIEAICKITIFFCSEIINLLFDGLAYHTSGHFAHCSYFSLPLWGSKKYYATRKISARLIC